MTGEQSACTFHNTTAQTSTEKVRHHAEITTGLINTVVRKLLMDAAHRTTIFSCTRLFSLEAERVAPVSAGCQTAEVNIVSIPLDKFKLNSFVAPTAQISLVICIV